MPLRYKLQQIIDFDADDLVCPYKVSSYYGLIRIFRDYASYQNLEEAYNKPKVVLVHI